jgi:tryptophan synthase alpha chain
MQLKNPLLIGFGISDAVTFDRACHHAHGAIIGSAFINRISDTMDIERDVQAFIAGVKGVQT